MATLHVHGVGDGTQSFLNTKGTAERRAKADLDKDFERVRAVTPCPKCGWRDEAAVRRWWLPHLLWGPGLGALVALCALAMTGNMRPADLVMARWICVGLFVFIAGGIVGVAWFKWSQIPGRVEFRPYEHGGTDDEAPPT